MMAFVPRGGDTGGADIRLGAVHGFRHVVVSAGAHPTRMLADTATIDIR